MPQNEIGNSPSTPVLLMTGPFAGQLLFGDVTYGGLQRAFLEKVNGEYQGAVFRHTQGLEAGINEVPLGPDGAIYVGGLGAGGNWGQEGKLTYGLQKLTPNGTNAFDIKPMRASHGGFEIEYTQPLSAETAQELADAYQVKQWRYGPTEPVRRARRSTRRRSRSPRPSCRPTAGRSRCQIAGLKAGRVVHMRSPRPFIVRRRRVAVEHRGLVHAQRDPGPGGAAADVLRGRGGPYGRRRHGDRPRRLLRRRLRRRVRQRRRVDHASSVDVREAGTYDLAMRYSNGPNPYSGDEAAEPVRQR